MMKARHLITVGIIGLTSLVMGAIVHAGNFQDVIFETLQGEATAGKTLDKIMQPYTLSSADGDANMRDFLVFVAVKILLPMAVLLGIVIAILGFYKLMSSTSVEEENKGIGFLLWGTIGVIIMVAAGYFTNTLVGDLGTTGIIGQYETGGDPSGGEIASAIYDKLFFPMLRLFIYVILGILFIAAVMAGFRYIFSNDEGAQKKALSIALFNAMGIIVIILAKSMVESIYGDYSEVTKDINNVGEVGTGVFENPQIGSGSVLATVINWIMGLAMLFILIILVYQSYLLLTNPSNEDMIKKIKKNIVYVFIGILVIGAGYLLTNFFIIN